MATKSKSTHAPRPSRARVAQKSIPTDVHLGSEREFFARVRAQVSQPRAEGSVGTRTIVSFESVEALLAVLTPKRHAVFEAVRRHGGFESIEALALASNRDRAAVSRDVKALSEAGLLTIRKTVQPGHGTRTEISALAADLTLQVEL